MVVFLNKLLSLLGFRKDQLYWGVVYDSVTKQPIDPAIVKLIHVNSGKAVETCITDMQGRYGFLSHPGKFKIFVQRTNYQFPSQRTTGTSDGVYDNLYHGEFFDLVEDSDVIALNIPLDPMQFDWNQQAKTTVVNPHPFLHHLLLSLVRILFWAALLVCVLMAYVQDEKMLYYNVLGVYAFVFLLAVFTPRVRLWGRVFERTTGQPIQGLTVEIAHPELESITIAKAVTSQDGKFFLRANKGHYQLIIKDKSEEGPSRVMYKNMVTVGGSGIVNKEIGIDFPH